MTTGVGDRFFQETKYHREHMPAGRLDLSRRPLPFKTYPDAATVMLDPPEVTDGMPFWKAVSLRRSRRHYSGEPVRKLELSQILWGSQGITGERSGHPVRSAPSAGALYPIETYLVVNACDAIASGIYHYDVQNHRLETLQLGDFHLDVARAALDQEMAAHASAVFIWTAVFERTRWKYSERAYRYVHLDAGHIAAHVSLAAVALGLGSCQIAALYDEEVNRMVGVDGVAESTVYMTSVGRPAAR